MEPILSVDGTGSCGANLQAEIGQGGSRRQTSRDAKDDARGNGAVENPIYI